MSLIERIRDEFAIPIVYVTHSVEEVRRLASRVVRIVAGRVTATGTAAEVLGR
jgi:molybdate transport system ATP-binding protein